MGDLSGLSWPVVLSFGNLILSSAIVITAFSLLGFMLTHNLRSRVAQTFNILLACVLIVFAADIVVPRVESDHAALIWLRVQWIGIAMVPAAYLHFSYELLRTTHHYSLRSRVLVGASYILSAALTLAALFTDWLVYDGTFSPPVSHLTAGPLFPVFVAYFVLAAAYGAGNVYRARRRSLTRTSRRRMTYLTVSMVAPGLGVFPYLVSLGFAAQISPAFVLLLQMVVNAAVGTMLVVMAYSVAYYGVLSPDRVIKHDLIHYLLRGPVVGILAIIVMLVMPRVELILGLPRNTALIFAVVGLIVMGQLAVNAGKSWIERLIYRQDREEILWIQALERRLLTSSDLEQFLINVLAGLCEVLRVNSGFVLVQADSGFRVEAAVGSSDVACQFADSPEARAVWDALAEECEEQAGHPNPCLPAFRAGTDFWYCPLHSQDGGKLLGLLAVGARGPEVDMDAGEESEATALLLQASSALSDRYVQQGVFATLQQILPDLEQIQEWKSALHFAPPPRPATTGEAALEPDMPLVDGNWQQWVKDALSHYWGGPKLTESPLANLHVVRRAMRGQDSNLTRALRSVLQEAIDRQRPPGERKLPASEWLLYNILDLRFVQGERVRDIASRLAISESDLYRKQRVAVAEVARTLAEMEAVAALDDAHAHAEEPAGEPAEVAPSQQ